MARAGATVSVKVRGKEKIFDALDTFGHKAKTEVRRVIRKYALRIERTAKRMAPVDTGRLRASIRTRLEGLAAWVMTNVLYAPFQEFGTGRLGAEAGIEDVPPEYEYGPSRGMSPNSFLRPAFEEHIAAFVKELTLAIKRHT